MPISREELEQGRIDLTLPIMKILAGRPDLGFSPDEVQQLLVETEGRDAALAEVEKSLETLVLRERVQVREMEGRRWYTIVQRRLGFRTE